jgi:hypothetical protein
MNDNGYVPFVVSTARSCRHSLLITGFVNRLTLQVSPMRRNCLAFRSTCLFSLVRVTRSLVACICFVSRWLYVRLSLFFWPLCCLSFFHLRILITLFVSLNSSFYVRISIMKTLMSWLLPMLMYEPPPPPDQVSRYICAYLNVDAI